MELSHRGAEGENLLRRGERAGVVMPQRSQGLEGEGEGGDGEIVPFLRYEPVKLTPAWEGSNLSNDTLNLKGITMNRQDQPQRRLELEGPPEDKWNLIYFTLLFHGLGSLAAWNMFITAKGYFEKYKLANTDYAHTFMVNLGYASQLPNLIFSWVNVFITIGGDLTLRIVLSLAAEVLIFIITIALAMTDSSTWIGGFFWITMLSAFMLNAFNAVFQNSVFGVAGRLPPKYTGAVILGTNVCGTVVVLLDWATASAGGSLRTSAIYYFIGGMLVLIICFDTYFALPLNKFYRYHERVNRSEAAIQPAGPHGAASSGSRTPWKMIISKIWPQMYNVWFVFTVSLACFPAVQSEITSTATPGFMGDNFVRVTCFFTFNFFAMLGCISATYIKQPQPRWLYIATSIRAVFFPLILMCNYHPPNRTRTMAVFFKSDLLYWFIAMLLAWSSGHCSSLAMQYMGHNLPREYTSKAGMLGGAMLVTGIITGIMVSSLAPYIVSTVGSAPP